MSQTFLETEVAKLSLSVRCPFSITNLSATLESRVLHDHHPIIIGLGDTRLNLTSLDDTATHDFVTHKVEVKDRKSTRLNSSHSGESRMPSSA